MPLKTLILGAAIAGAMTALAGPASAYVVCNRDGDCWHTETRYSRPGLRFDYYPDDYYFHQNWDRRHWRGHREGRGYWRNGIWLTF